MNISVLKNFDKEKTGFFRFKKLGAKYLITNDFGDFHFLNEKDFEKFTAGRLDRKSDIYRYLAKKSFIRNRLNFGHMVSKWQSFNKFLWKGTGLHIVVVTIRCDHNCVYCQANSRNPKDKSYDMSLETARKTVERIFECPNPNVDIEFQGGEPLLNFPAVKEVIKTAKKLGRKTGKKFSFSVVTNLTSMTDDKLKFLCANNVSICTSIDGPKKIHNLNRVYTAGDSYGNAAKWVKSIKRKTKGKIHPSALLTVTKAALKYPKEIVDEYLKLNTKGIFIRNVTPLGMAGGVWSKVGYSPDEFLKFYKKALDYIIDININKKPFKEMTAIIFLMKILARGDFNFMDMRSPCGAGIGQIAYYYNGDVYTCDEARMISEMGDASFCIGNVYKNRFADFINSPATKCLVTSSCSDVQTTCSWCVYKPYCGVCPVWNYVTENDLYGRMPENIRCKINEGIMDLLFKKINNPKYFKVFSKWTSQN
jgi:His-Xaa-Ser system radical SAM maturase HxsB